MSHEWDDAGRGSGQLEEGVLEELQRRGSLRRLPHQHQVQEGAQHGGHLARSRTNTAGSRLTLVLLFEFFYLFSFGSADWDIEAGNTKWD